MTDPLSPLVVYGASISYYTGKMEAYLRYKEIPYELKPTSPSRQRKIRKEVHAAQIPAIELADGRIMTDTTPMIAWLEERNPEPAVIPEDPLQNFLSHLVEDYAEEWLWRPAMHYRWSYPGDARLLSRRAAEELLPEIPLPFFLKRNAMRIRQHVRFVKQDGVTRKTWAHVEGVYLKTLAQLEAIFAKRPYMLGGRPTLADFGFFASMFRHFSQDPTASEIMRTRAPAVYAWQARLWNARASRVAGRLLDGIPPDWYPILREIGSAYLPFLNANAEAWHEGKPRFDADVQGVLYRKIPVSQYRVWCLEQLRKRYNCLPEAARGEAQDLLAAQGCWAPLWEIEQPESRYDPHDKVPFYGRRVHYDNA